MKLGTPYFLFFTVQTHGLTSVVAVLDVLLGAIPIRLLHFYQPVIFLIVYYSFTAIFYTATGGKMIYLYLDWSEPGPTLKTVSFYFLFALICYLFIFLLKTFQVRYCCSGTSNHKQNEETAPLIRKNQRVSTMVPSDNDALYGI